MKKNLLALVHGEWSSHTILAVEIAKALRKTGDYEIIFSGTGEYMQKMVEPAEFKWIDTPKISKKQIYETITTKLIPKIFTNEDAEKYYQIESELLAKQKPDIILRDHFRELAGIVAKEKGIYDVFIQKANCSNYYYMEHFRPSSFPRALDIILPMWVVHPFAHKIQDLIKKGVYRPISNQVKKRKLSLNPDVPEGYEPDLVLFPDSEKLFSFPQRKDLYKYLGPVLSNEDNTTPRWLDNFINDKRKKVVITSGSTALDNKTEMFVKAFEDNNFAVAIDTAGDNPIPKTFYGRNKFNINSVLPYADVFITHGGTGSMYFGLREGIPLLIIPNHFEQEINGNQLEKLGLGLSLMKKNLSVRNIRKNIEKIISNSSFKKNAKAFSQTMEKKDPRDLAVKYISEGYEQFKINF